MIPPVKNFLLITLSTLVLSSAGSLFAEPSSHQHHSSEMGHSEGEHHHGMVTIPEGQPVPRVDLMVYPDPVNGWNLELKLENFALAPERVNEENQPNEGHAHLFVNGKKMGRIYSNWYHLSELPQGDNEIKVSLNTNQHEFLMYQGKTIEDVETVTVQ